MKKCIQIFLVLFVLLSPELMQAQCAMCRAVLETGGGQEMAKGINDGIVYLMAIPYVLVAVVGYFVYKKMQS